MRKPKKIDVGKYVFLTSLIIYPAILFLIFYVGINLNSVIMAFQNIHFDGTKSFAGLDNFKAFFASFTEGNIIMRSIVNSLKMYALNLVICMPLYIVFSYYLFKRWPANNGIRIVIMLPAIISGFVMCLLFKKFVEVALPGMLKQLFGVEIPNLLTDENYSFGTSIFYMIWVSFSTSLIVYSNAMKEIDHEIFEAAQIDGAGVGQEIFKIVLPMIYPTITTFLVLGVAGIFTNNGPILAFFEYGAPPEVYNLGYYITQRSMRVNMSEYPQLAAIGIVLTLVMAPVTIGIKNLLGRFGPEVDG